jgi:hypothetical protein
MMKSQTESNAMSKTQLFLYGSVNWILCAAGLANLVVGTFAAVNDSVATSATSLTAGLVLLFAGTIDRFESLKGLGIEAKTRQLDQKIVQADDALRRLREMAEITGAALLDINSKIGRWDSTPEPRDSIALANRVRQIMKSLGSDDVVIGTALKPWAKTLCFDMASVQIKELNKLLVSRSTELQTQRQNIPSPWQPDDPQLLKLNAQLSSISEFQNARLNNLYNIEIEDYPDKFMAIFDNVPQVEKSLVDTMKKSAARFSPGMQSLSQTRTLVDSELWIEVLQNSKNT